MVVYEVNKTLIDPQFSSALGLHKLKSGDIIDPFAIKNGNPPQSKEVINIYLALMVHDDTSSYWTFLLGIY